MKRILKGSVVKLSGEKTVRVLVCKNRIHKKYHKVIALRRYYLVHDAKGACVLGDNVSISECRPISKLKSFIIININRNDS